MVGRYICPTKKLWKLRHTFPPPGWDLFNEIAKVEFTFKHSVLKISTDQWILSVANVGMRVPGFGMESVDAGATGAAAQFVPPYRLLVVKATKDVRQLGPRRGVTPLPQESQRVQTDHRYTHPGSRETTAFKTARPKIKPLF